MLYYKVLGKLGQVEFLKEFIDFQFIKNLFPKPKQLKFSKHYVLQQIEKLIFLLFLFENVLMSSSIIKV